MQWHLPISALLLALAGAASAAARRADPSPPTGISGVAGGLGSLAAQGLWLRADRALQAHEEGDAILMLRTIAQLAPHVASTSRYAAFEIGSGLAAQHPDQDLRWSMTREALRILDDTIRANPASPDARTNRGSFLAVRVAPFPEMASRFRRDIDPHGVNEAVRADYAAAVAADPADAEWTSILANAAATAGIDALRDGRADHALAAFDESLAAFVLLFRSLETVGGRKGRAWNDQMDRMHEAEGIVRELRDAAALDDLARSAALASIRAKHPGLLD